MFSGKIQTPKCILSTAMAQVNTYYKCGLLRMGVNRDEGKLCCWLDGSFKDPNLGHVGFLFLRKRAYKV